MINFWRIKIFLKNKNKNNLKNKIINILKLSSDSKDIEVDSFSILLLIDQLENEYNTEIELDDFDIKKASKMKYLLIILKKKLTLNGVG